MERSDPRSVADSLRVGSLVVWGLDGRWKGELLSVTMKRVKRDGKQRMTTRHVERPSIEVVVGILLPMGALPTMLRWVEPQAAGGPGARSHVEASRAERSAA